MFLRSACLSLVVGLTLVGPLSAQALPGSAQAGIELGRQYGGTYADGSDELFTSAVRMRDCSMKGFWFGTQLTEAWGLELSTRRSATHFYLPPPSELPPPAVGAWMEYAVVDAAAVRTWRFGKVEVYGLLGAGIANLNINVPSKAYRDTNRASLCGGGGARVWAWRRVAFRLEARAHAAYLQELQGGQDRGAFDPGRWLRTEELMCGVLYSF